MLVSVDPNTDVYRFDLTYGNNFYRITKVKVASPDLEIGPNCRASSPSTIADKIGTTGGHGSGKR